MERAEAYWSSFLAEAGSAGGRERWRRHRLERLRPSLERAGALDPAWRPVRGLPGYDVSADGSSVRFGAAEVKLRDASSEPWVKACGREWSASDLLALSVSPEDDDWRPLSRWSRWAVSAAGRVADLRRGWLCRPCHRVVCDPRDDGVASPRAYVLHGPVPVAQLMAVAFLDVPDGPFRVGRRSGPFWQPDNLLVVPLDLASVARSFAVLHASRRSFLRRLCQPDRTLYPDAPPPRPQADDLAAMVDAAPARRRGRAPTVPRPRQGWAPQRDPLAALPVASPPPAG
jgi:hypothetical protein